MSKFDNAYSMRPLLFGDEPTNELIYVISKFGLCGNALELGCGDGRDTKHLLELGFNIEAIDQSIQAIRNLINRRDITSDQKMRLNAYACDVNSYNWNRMFDFVYGITILDHLSREAGVSVIKQAFNAVNQGGYIFFKVHTVDDAGNTKKGQGVSEFANEIKHYYKHNELLELSTNLGHVLYYIEAFEEDHDHGDPHTHVYASVLIRKEKSNEHSKNNT